MLPGAPPVADAGTEADTSEALAHSAVAIAKSEAPAKAREHLPAGAAAARRPGQGLRRVRSRAREDLSRADGAPGLSRAARGPGGVGPQRAAHPVGEHPGLVQHALRGGRRARHPREPDPGHPGGVRRRLRRQDPRALRADHRGARAGHQAAGPLRDDPPRRAAGGHARPAGHHQAQDRRQARRHPHGARRGDRHRLRRLLRRGAGGERGLPRQHVQVAVVRHPRLRGADPQAERGRLSRAGGAADHLRDRVADGADRPRPRSRLGRVPDAPPDPGRRSDGERAALAVQRRQAGARPHRRAPALEDPQAVGGRRGQERQAPRGGPGPRRLARRPPAHRARRSA